MNVIRRQLIRLVLYTNKNVCIEWFATNSRELAGSFTTVRGRKMSNKQGMAGTLEEAVFKLILYMYHRYYITHPGLETDHVRSIA